MSVADMSSFFLCAVYLAWRSSSSSWRKETTRGGGDCGAGVSRKLRMGGAGCVAAVFNGMAGGGVKSW